MSDKLYDLGQLEALAGGSDDFVDSMVETFLEHTPLQLNEMMEAYHNGDVAMVGNVAHKIKPNIDLFGIHIIKEDIRQIEQKGRNEENDADFKASIERVEKVLQQAFNELKGR